MFDILVFAMRGRPFGTQHLYNIRSALDQAQYCFVLIGSADEPVNFRNPFTAGEVAQMVRGSLSDVENDRVFVFEVQDQSTDLKWVTEVQRLVNAKIKLIPFGREPKIGLIGHSKDDSSYYLRLFPTWGSINTANYRDNLSATMVRNVLYNATNPQTEVAALYGDHSVPIGTHVFLRQWVDTERFEQMRAEYRANVLEGHKFGKHPYNEGHYHLTADLAMFQAGSIALVKRREAPGKGLWALPGGHLRYTERFKDAAVREFAEETDVLADDLANDLTADDLALAIRAEMLLDDPWRSTRMRTVGMAFGGILPGTRPLVVRGADDADEARMWQVNEVTRSMMFEDHFLIIQHFANLFNIQ